MATDSVVGIDLGTTFSAIAYVNEHGKPEIIPNREGERITPSAVLFDGDAPVVGTIAKRSAVAHPLNVCQFVKRVMGDKGWRFLAGDDTEYSAEEVSAFILRRLKEDAETTLDCAIRDAVITVPAYFNDAQRKATQDAGTIAGLNVLRIVNEPTAAALAYGVGREQEEHTVMVYDLGGGTFDVTLLRVAPKEIDVLATSGDKNLGGFDWDNKIMVYLNEQFQKQGGTDLIEDLGTQQELRDKAEIAKKTLSSRDNTKVFLSAFGKDVTVNLSREVFEEITGDLLDRTETLMQMTLEDSGLTWASLDRMLLVGGSTRMKAVSGLVERVSGRKPSFELHADEVVAVGAALLGGILQKEASEVKPAHLDGLPAVSITDVNSHSLGIVAVDARTGSLYNSVILRKDTKIPTRASNTYATITDNQTEIEVEVTEGEEEDLEYVHIIGRGTMHIPPYSKGAPIEVFFHYDNDGIIHVTVLDTTSKKQLGELHIERQSNRTASEIDEMRNRLEATDVQ